MGRYFQVRIVPKEKNMEFSTIRTETFVYKKSN